MIKIYTTKYVSEQLSPMGFPLLHFNFFIKQLHTYLYRPILHALIHLLLSLIVDYLLSNNHLVSCIHLIHIVVFISHQIQVLCLGDRSHGVTYQGSCHVMLGTQANMIKHVMLLILLKFHIFYNFLLLFQIVPRSFDVLLVKLHSQPGKDYN